MIHYPPSLDGHDLKACSMEGIKRGLGNQSDVSFPSPTLVSRTPYSCDSKDVHEGVKMQATALRHLDVSQGDVKLGQDADENAGHSVAPIPYVFGTALTRSEHSVAAPSSDIGANGFPSGTLCVTCSVIAPVVPPYGVRGSIQDDPLPVDRNVPAITSNVIENDPKLAMALAHWTVEWLHLLIVQPHHHKGYPFAYVLAFLPLSALVYPPSASYRGDPVNVCPALALRISRVIRNLHSPAQVIIHALWYITVLARDDKFEREDLGFLKIPIFQYLHSKGSVCAEDFMLRTFAVCAMIADKWINDQSFAAKVWLVVHFSPVTLANGLYRARIGRMPDVTFTVLEAFVLNNLNWKLHMTSQQWKDMLVMLRSSEHSWLDFSPFTPTPSPRRVTVVRVLDKLILLADASGVYAGSVGHDYEISLCPTPGFLQRSLHIYAPQPIRPITAQLLVPLEWCPEADPIVNKRPRIVGIAPGADRDVSIPKPAMMTARDLLDLILRPPRHPVFMPLLRPAGTSFCGPFGAIGQRLVHTVGLSPAWPTSSWFPSQG